MADVVALMEKMTRFEILAELRKVKPGDKLLVQLPPDTEVAGNLGYFGGENDEPEHIMAWGKYNLSSADMRKLMVLCYETEWPEEVPRSFELLICEGFNPDYFWGLIGTELEAVKIAP